MSARNKVLITGSSGMLGRDLWQELSGRFELYGLDVAGRADESDCDITDKKKVAGLISKIRPDIVVHAAAWTDVDGCELDKKKAHEVNCEGTRNVALACRKAKAALVYISTDFVFDGKKKRPYRESDRPNPLSVYGDSKLKGEEAVKKVLKKYFILRTSWLYGKKGKNFVDTILAKARSERALMVVSDQRGSPTYTKDLAKAIRALLETRDAKHGIYHVSNSGSITWYDYAKEILALAGSDARVQPISSDELEMSANRPAMSVLDNSKFSRYTGYKMRHWREALREYIGE